MMKKEGLLAGGISILIERIRTLLVKPLLSFTLWVTMVTSLQDDHK